MANGQVLHGKGGLPVFGKNGTILYAAQVSMAVDIVISWEGGNDVDICAFYNVAQGSLGYSHHGYGDPNDDHVITDNGFFARWAGDNTSGGPETLRLEYSGNRSSLADVYFDIHANWFSVGRDAEGNEQSGGGPATVTATDARGTTKSFTIMPATSKGRAAQSGDPGVRINFNTNGTIKSITAC